MSMPTLPRSTSLPWNCPKSWSRWPSFRLYLWTTSIKCLDGLFRHSRLEQVELELDSVSFDYLTDGCLDTKTGMETGSIKREETAEFSIPKVQLCVWTSASLAWNLSDLWDESIDRRGFSLNGGWQRGCLCWTRNKKEPTWTERTRTFPFGRKSLSYPLD